MKHKTKILLLCLGLITVSVLSTVIFFGLFDVCMDDVHRGTDSPILPSRTILKAGESTTIEVDIPIGYWKAVKEAETKPTFDDLLDAICYVESRGDAHAVGDNDKAIGAYQIHKIYVDDVNRIGVLRGYPDASFSYEDRWDKDKSRSMTLIYTGHYGAKALDNFRTKDKQKAQMIFIECAARIHNGGPQGYKNPSTEKYWLKVKARLETN